MTNIEITYGPITVDDIDAALGFYRDALGLEVVRDVANGDHHWVTLRMPGQEGVEVVLSQPGGGRSPEDADALHRLVAKGMMPPTVFRTTDLDAMFEKVSSSGAEVLQEPIKQPWGPRDCAFRDPAGNMVRINAAE